VGGHLFGLAPSQKVVDLVTVDRCGGMRPSNVRAPSAITAAQYLGFSSVREATSRSGHLGAGKRDVQEALTNHRPLVLRGDMPVMEQVELLRQWKAYVYGAGGEARYVTSGHGLKPLREVWDALMPMQIESGVYDEDANPILQFLEQPDASPSMRRQLGLFRQLQNTAAEGSSGIAEIRNPAFINGQRPSQSPITHFDDYESFVLVVTGVKVFFLAEYNTFKDFPVRGKVNERAGINPYNLAYYAPGMSPAHLDRCEQGDWSVAVLTPGDVLYLPRGCWHWVQSEPKTTMVNHWWVNVDAASPLPAAGERRMIFARLRGRGAEVQDESSSSNAWVRPEGYDSGEALEEHNALVYEHNASSPHPQPRAMASWRFDLDGSLYGSDDDSEDDAQSIYSAESMSVQLIDHAWLPLVLAYFQQRPVEATPVYLTRRSVCMEWRDEVVSYNPPIHRHARPCLALEWFLKGRHMPGLDML